MQRCSIVGHLRTSFCRVKIEEKKGMTFNMMLMIFISTILILFSFCQLHNEHTSHAITTCIKLLQILLVCKYNCQTYDYCKKLKKKKWTMIWHLTWYWWYLSKQYYVLFSFCQLHNVNINGSSEIIVHQRFTFNPTVNKFLKLSQFTNIKNSHQQLYTAVPSLEQYQYGPI